MRRSESGSGAVVVRRIAASVALACLTVACGPAGQRRGPVPLEPASAGGSSVEAAKAHPTPASINPWSEEVRSLLLIECGRCHEPGLATSLPGALAVFDLTEDPWYGRMDNDQIESIDRRISGRSTVPERDKNLVRLFIGCAVRGECNE